MAINHTTDSRVKSVVKYKTKFRHISPGHHDVHRKCISHLLRVHEKYHFLDHIPQVFHVARWATLDHSWRCRGFDVSAWSSRPSRRWRQSARTPPTSSAPSPAPLPPAAAQRRQRTAQCGRLRPDHAVLLGPEVKLQHTAKSKLTFPLDWGDKSPKFIENRL